MAQGLKQLLSLGSFLLKVVCPAPVLHCYVKWCFLSLLCLVHWLRERDACVCRACFCLEVFFSSLSLFFSFFFWGGGGGAGGLLCLGVLGRTEEEILDVSQGNAHPEVKSNVLYFVVYLSICM